MAIRNRTGVLRHAGGAIDFIQDLAKGYPTLFRNYQAMLPQEFATATWLYRLDGVTLSIDEGLMIGGVPFIRVYGCKPHDCGDDQVSLIFSTDGKVGAIKVRSQELTGGSRSSSVRTTRRCAASSTGISEHDPEKWIPVFRKIMLQEIGRDLEILMSENGEISPSPLA